MTVEMLLEGAGGAVRSFEEFLEQAGKGGFSAAWIVGGYPRPWVDKKLAGLAKNIQLLVVQDLFENELTSAAAIVLPSCAWAERNGSFANATGVLQPFERAIDPPDGAQRDGQYLYEIAGYEGLYTGERVRELMAQSLPALANAREAPPEPVHAH